MTEADWAKLALLSRGSRISRSVMAADFINVGGSGHAGWHKWSPRAWAWDHNLCLDHCLWTLCAANCDARAYDSSHTRRRFTASLFRIPANHCPSTGLARAIDHTRRIHRRFFYRHCKSEGFGFFLSYIWAFRRTNTFCKNTTFDGRLMMELMHLYTCASPSPGWR